MLFYFPCVVKRLTYRTVLAIGTHCTKKTEEVATPEHVAIPQLDEVLLRITAFTVQCSLQRICANRLRNLFLHFSWVFFFVPGWHGQELGHPALHDRYGDLAQRRDHLAGARSYFLRASPWYDDDPEAEPAVMRVPPALRIPLILTYIYIFFFYCSLWISTDQLQEIRWETLHVYVWAGAESLCPRQGNYQQTGEAHLFDELSV